MRFNDFQGFPKDFPRILKILRIFDASGISRPKACEFEAIYRAVLPQAKHSKAKAIVMNSLLKALSGASRWQLALLGMAFSF